MSNYQSPGVAGILAPLRSNEERIRGGDERYASLNDARMLAPEEYARLHTEIERASSPSRCFVVGVTSAVYGEGKTTVAMNLAVTIAQNSHERVALVDLNLRNRDLQARLNLAPCAGVVDIVEDGEDNVAEVVHRTEYENFTIVPAGRRSGNPARLARSPRLGEVIGALRAKNEIIVIDMAPVLPVTDTRILARLVDGIVMVVRAGVTPREIVARAIDAVGEDRVLGVVLNGTETAMPKWLRRYFGGAFSDL
jgi:capsular exopolysaccharide synthesis family protein